jgi:uncharacterized protein
MAMLRGASVVALVLPAVAMAQDFEAGMDAYISGDYVRAAEVWTALAEQGDAEAQYELAFLHYAGLGVPEDQAEAARLYRLAAEQGMAEAKLWLGFLYQVGLGVEEDPTEAARWYALAAAQGNEHAQASLGGMYEVGEGVPQDYAEAARYYRLAAKQDEPNAQNQLGHLYLAGLGVPRDEAEALRLFRLAADEVGLWHFKEDLAVLLATGSEALRDPVAALAWFTIAAEAGSHDALKPLDKLSWDLPPDEVTRAEALARGCLDSDFRACE